MYLSFPFSLPELAHGGVDKARAMSAKYSGQAVETKDDQRGQCDRRSREQSDVFRDLANNCGSLLHMATSRPGLDVRRNFRDNGPGYSRESDKTITHTDLLQYRLVNKYMP
jgi:hypothetical protein